MIFCRDFAQIHEKAVQRREDPEGMTSNRAAFCAEKREGCSRCCSELNLGRILFFTQEREADVGEKGVRGLITRQVPRTCRTQGPGCVGAPAGLGTGSGVMGMWDYSEDWPLPAVGGARGAKVSRIPETWARTGQPHPAAKAGWPRGAQGTTGGKLSAGPAATGVESRRESKLGFPGHLCSVPHCLGPQLPSESHTSL